MRNEKSGWVGVWALVFLAALSYAPVTHAQDDGDDSGGQHRREGRAAEDANHIYQEAVDNLNAAQTKAARLKARFTDIQGVSNWQATCDQACASPACEQPLSRHSIARADSVTPANARCVALWDAVHSYVAPDKLTSTASPADKACLSAAAKGCVLLQRREKWAKVVAGIPALEKAKRQADQDDINANLDYMDDEGDDSRSSDRHYKQRQEQPTAPSAPESVPQSVPAGP